MTVKKGHEMTDQVSHVEEVLAFVHDTKTWRDMETEERLEWCRRVALVLDDLTNDRFGAWTQTALAPVLGISRQAVGDRLGWSERVSESGHGGPQQPNNAGPTYEQRRAKAFFSNPAIVGERKAEIVAEALADEYVAERVAEAIGSDPTLIARYEKAKARVQPATGSNQGRAASLNPDDWQSWTASQQEEFDTKTVKAARHLLVANFIKSQGYVASGEAEMLLNIVRPPSDMDSELQDLITQEGRP